VKGKSSTFLSLFLVVMLLAALGLSAGCAAEDEPEDDVTTEEPAEEPEEEEEVVALPGEGIKVAMVSDVGGLGDKSFNDAAWLGMETARDALGVEVDFLESNEVADYAPNVDQLVGAGYDLIYTVGFMMSSTTMEKGLEYPDVLFAGIDQYLDPIESNMTGVLFREQEGSYLAGVLAGMATTDLDLADVINEDKKVCFIGGMEGAVIGRFEAGFRAGVTSVDPEIEVIVLYSGSFDNPDKGKELALTAIDQGADVIFHVAGPEGLGGVAACQEAGALIIGVDQDMYLTVEGSGDVMLSSMMKRVDSAVFETIEKLVNGEFPGGENASLGMAESAVGLAPFHDFESAVSDAIKAAIAAAEAGIMDGTIVVPASLDEL